MNHPLRERIAARTLAIAVPVLAIGALLLAALQFLLIPDQTRRLIPIGLLLLSSLASYGVSRISRPKPALIVLGLGTTVAIAVGMLLSGGVQSPAYTGSLVVVVLVAASFGRRPLALVVALVIAVGGLLVAAEALGWIPGPLPLPPMAHWGIISIFALLTAALVYIPVSLLQDALARSERQAEELARARERLFESEKLETLGRLAGGIAHDFNNVLSAILGATELLRLEPGVPRAELVDLIHDAAGRAAELTRSLTLYARRMPMELRPTDLADVARSAALLLERTVDKRITIEASAEPGPTTLLGSPGHLEHALLNLCFNARDAMAGTGRLTLSTRRVALRGDETDLVPGPLPAGPYVAVAVRDTGSGIEPGVRLRIFEPFFTTKGIGQGTGLGLSSVIGTVAAHRGALRVESEPGRGSCFTMLLPFRSDLAPEKPERAPDRPKDSGRVLLVDDEAVLRDLGARILGQAGYAVETAAEGREALERVRAVPGGYDLVVVDLAMPVMGGRDFCFALRALDRDVPVIMTTGYCSSDTLDELLGLGGPFRVLEKPYAADALIALASQMRRRS